MENRIVFIAGLDDVRKKKLKKKHANEIYTWGRFYKHCLTNFGAWIDNHIHILWYALIHPKPPLNVEDGWMMTSSNGNIVRVTGHLCRKFTGPGEFPDKGQRRGALMFSLICVWISDWVKIMRLVIWDALAPIMTSLWWNNYIQLLFVDVITHNDAEWAHLCQ